jgi:hypothetical protein
MLTSWGRYPLVTNSLSVAQGTRRRLSSKLRRRGLLHLPGLGALRPFWRRGLVSGVISDSVVGAEEMGDGAAGAAVALLAAERVRMFVARVRERMRVGWWRRCEMAVDD